MSFCKPKIAIIGGGNIGGVLAQLAASRELGDIAVLDIVEDLAKGKCLDIAESAAAEGFDVKLTGDHKPEVILKDAHVVIVTAGIARKPGMSRDDLLSINSKIIKEVAENIKKYAPKSYIIVISNPLDAMVTLMKAVTGFPANRVMGQAGVLDSSRFASFIAWELEVSVKDINALVLGGHGDTMVPLIKYANVAGIPVMEMLERKYKSKEKAVQVMNDIVKRTADAGGEVVRLLKTGSAFYSPAASAIAMVESILKDQKRILPTCAYLDGEFGVKGLYVGVPAILGANGVEKIVELTLSDDEQKMFDHSISAVKELIDVLKELKFL